MSAEQLADPTRFPKWVHAVEVVDEAGTSQSEWSGHLAALKNEVKEMRSANEDSLQVHLDERLSRTEQRSAMQAKGVKAAIAELHPARADAVAAVDARVGALESKLDEVLQAVLAGARMAGQEGGAPVEEA